MTRGNRIVEKKDLIVNDIYAKNRKELRKKTVQFKKNRRVFLGPYATFYFENFDTMLAQIQEMLYIEKGGDKQLKDELNAYNPLIPKGKELITTLMFEIDDTELRTKFLRKIGGIEKKIYLKFDEDKIKGVAESDVDRTSTEGKASSVQFIHFNFSEIQIQKFKDFKTKIKLGIDHHQYNYITTISENTKKSLIKDFT